ncbi:MAG: alkaline phosphatase D family protein [Saprospiraceae bacterium]
MKNILSYAFLLLFTLPALLFGQANDQLIDHNRQLDFRNPPAFNPDWAPFFHGVASGDPLEDRVIIWTRVTPEEMEITSVELSWQMATDPALENVVQSGLAHTDASKDFTVKVDVTGLQAGQVYYYGFSYNGKHSLTGRTKTSPGSHDVDHLKFGVVSCSNYQAGYFNTYRHLAKRNDLDAIIHLGDYIYEYADGSYGNAGLFTERALEPTAEIVSLEEYRTRYSTYRLDTNLIRAHQQTAFITVWDDHETANDAYMDGAQNHTEGVEGTWEDRKAAGKQAYFEWMPIRDNETRRVYRSIKYGNLMDLILLDTRLEGREKQLNDVTGDEINDENRTILGNEQKQWLLQQLSNSTAKWKVIGQQVIFSELNIGWTALADTTLGGYYDLESFFLDIWDGYPAERSQIIKYIKDNQITNTIILTGDFHSTFAFDVADHPIDVSLQVVPGLGTVPFFTPNANYVKETGAGAVAVEFATPSITSANFDENSNLTIATILQSQINRDIQPSANLNLGNPNPHMKYADLIKHGYFILDVQTTHGQANWYYSDILNPTASESFSQAWYTKEGESHLQKAESESPPKAQQDIPAPNNPPGLVNTLSDPTEAKVFALLGIYPNPLSEESYLHYGLSEKARVQINLIDASGKNIRQIQDQLIPQGIYSLKVDASGLAKGIYFYQIRVNGQLYSATVMKQ